ncbi:PucR family transcriptional regulator ligand-binding domain-containing protein [Nocardioides sambongensis]|uniref:PucR family transcriptional regulator ligand-binding domain-containing protein n=1 Tax=Nocardioides sambongensis TaxID=2589074 RepID=UPI0011286D9B|nr:PucR family transcriptional regulator ligand-binding domain-containing protein [Nocardioides sambongensis]
MSLTVGQLVALPPLRTRFLAGESGADRRVLWAHTCELPEPWEWLGTGDLLLTDGYGLPAEAAAQVDFLRELVRANLAGMAIASGQHAPQLTDLAVAFADSQSFPILETQYAVPFVTVARTVAEGNSEDSRRRLHVILSIYDILRRSLNGGRPSPGLLARIASEIHADLYVVDRDVSSLRLASARRSAPSSNSFSVRLRIRP